MTNFKNREVQNGTKDRETINHVPIVDRINSDNAFSDTGLENNRQLDEALHQDKNE